MPTRREILGFGGSVLGASVAGCNAFQGATGPTPDPTPSPGDAARTPEDAPAPYTRVYRETIDSVVLVQANRGQGTGFAIDDSYAVTNAHVVGQADSIDVRFGDGSWRSGDVVGRDPHSDLAAIALSDLPPDAGSLSFVQSEPAIGQEVVAIGNPYNLDGSLTTGIVSGTDRTIPAPTGYRIPDAIQTDAAVNPGNSGGPLVSLDGSVVAVINSGGGENIAFGISAALTGRVVPELIETGTYEHAYMGVSFTDVTPTIAEANDLEEPRGLLVADVVDGGPADGVIQPSTDATTVDGREVRAGGDVILAVDGTDLTTAEDLMSYLALQTRPGDTIDLTVVRDGSEQTVSLELGTRPE